MKLELGKFYKTKDGRKVRIICVDRKYEGWPVLGLVNETGFESARSYTENGKAFSMGEYYDIVSEWVEPEPKVLRAQYLIVFLDSSERIPETTRNWYVDEEDLRRVCAGYELTIIARLEEREFDR